MAAKLKNLKIRKVDLVDEGANPDAHIRMVKRKTGESQPADGGNRKETGNVLKRLLGFIGKAAGMEQEEIDSAVNEIQKGNSMSFGEKVNEVLNRKIVDEMWDICYALQASLCSILNDEDLDSTETSSAMQESLDEFYQVVKDAVPKWSGGKAASIAKRDEAASQEDLDIMNRIAERLSEDIAKACRQIHGVDESNENEKGDGEVMIDMSKMTDAERVFYESIVKRYGTEAAAEGQNAGGGVSVTETPAPQVQVPPQPAVIKSVTPPVPATAPQAEDIYKGLHPEVRAELEGLRKFQEETEERELTEVAKKYEIIGKKPEELVPLFKSLRASGGTAYNDMIAVLDQAVLTVEKSGVFSEIGKSGHGDPNGGAWAEANGKAVEIIKSKPGMTMAQALDTVFLADPALAERCEKED